MCPVCSNISSIHVPTGYSKIFYLQSTEHIENPHRGFMPQINSYASDYKLLTVGELDSVRASNGTSMIWRYFVLDLFVSSHISDEYLKTIDNDLYTIRYAGYTAVIRFCYTFKFTPKAPYGDANKYWILEHIKQLKPILQKYEGILTSVEAGFIGIWGEWFYTTYFGDPNKRDYKKWPKYGYPLSIWYDRKDVLEAVLGAIPKTTQVQLRYPNLKVDMWNSEIPTDYSDVLQQNNKSRTGHHNDCFVSSDDDVGTYHNKSFEYPYLHNDTRYCVVGGETCRLTTNDRDECPTALHEMEYFHWSFLNQDFKTAILDLWKQEGCYEEVHRRLGYRLALQQAILPDSVNPGGTLCYQFTIDSIGFAAPVKAMNVFLLLRSHLRGYFYAAMLPHDVRTWIPYESYSLSGSIHVPANFTTDSYEVYLAIGDKILTDHSDYYILLANQNVPVYYSGYNNLHHTITVTSQHSDDPTGCATLEYWVPPAQSFNSRVFHGNYTI
ncbi:uncharacterized protein LOC126818353 [Patella vulgata]|uniref:uncharacterized protein LOC126818353 n=1 Tax=Patella vulgata TaxID=6465 RepID=UPI0021802C36|nr:uncharacterized protein LOC126818353 [Patella vulgata]